ncbi:MAG: hypothetical protein ABI047_07160 [Jatrophihabitantaceae bacterium]
MPIDLVALAEAARKDGWATAATTIADIEHRAAILGWQTVPTRPGDPHVTNLRPSSSTPKPSLSATYGFGAFPLHTDGAHLQQPPDLVVLEADHPSLTPTLLWTFALEHERAASIRPDLRNGIFLVASASERTLQTAQIGTAIRFDPGCMTPCDQRARRVADFFGEALGRARPHLWKGPGHVLVIDNRRMLHARGQVGEADAGRSLTRLMLRTGSGS